MKKILLPVLCGLTLAQTAHAEQWAYSGKSGPENWAQLSEKFTACSGQNQSPINLTGFIDANLSPLTLKYNQGGNSIKNNGHTLQVDYSPGSFLTIDKVPYELKQFHFHAPSEHTLNGQSFPLEAHLVHADQAGHLTVVSVLFEQGQENSALEKLRGVLPAKAGSSHKLNTSFDVKSLLPQKAEYFRYNGSLTTPPCSEGVRWLVLKSPVTLSKPQQVAFEQALHHHNNRPLQSLNARVILQ
ncbi:carbonic anhydrase [Pleionea sp. CnH1-48]|uniref:carbonic anhydrase n=1 Tax=Pleionea sp. CnH1-48 TaxID=2954494 RepID=UPI0020977A5C|nr:carbonic anhydrase family protein [Pleionea sp. CnH1-48]MCO7224218.1 carbonic anhydrase family protein [Pleionea sp. CnH1-48]